RGGPSVSVAESTTAVPIQTCGRGAQLTGALRCGLARHGYVRNRSLRLLALAASPRYGPIARMSCTVRSVELCVYDRVFEYPALACRDSTIRPIGPSPDTPSSQVMITTPPCR